MDKKQQIHFWYFAAAFMVLLLVQSWVSQAPVTERVLYSTFLDFLESDRIASVTVRDEQVEGRYRDAIDGNTHSVTSIAPPDLTERLERSGADFGGKSRAKAYIERNTGVTFDDVAGVDEAKVELKEIVDFLKEPEKYGRLGAHYARAVGLLRDNHDDLEVGAQLLLERETITPADFAPLKPKEATAA